MLACLKNSCIIEHMDSKENMMTTYEQALKAITERDPGAYGIAGYGKNFSARVGYMTAYYVIVDGKIVGDVWYE